MRNAIYVHYLFWNDVAKALFGDWQLDKHKGAEQIAELLTKADETGWASMIFAPPMEMGADGEGQYMDISDWKYAFYGDIEKGGKHGYRNIVRGGKENTMTFAEVIAWDLVNGDSNMFELWWWVINRYVNPEFLPYDVTKAWYVPLGKITVNGNEEEYYTEPIFLLGI